MQPIRLMYDNAQATVDPARSLVFGHLVKLAAPVVKHYQSDLYHDAIWLSRYMEGATFSFYWSCDESGTAIGTQPAPLREHAYRLTVSNEQGAISLVIAEHARAGL